MAENVLKTRLSRGSWLAAIGEPAHDLRQRLRIAAAQIFEHVGETAAGAETDDRRRRQRQHRPAADLPELRSQARENRR